MDKKYFWKPYMDYYEFLRVNNFSKENDPVKIYNEITLEYLNKVENV